MPPTRRHVNGDNLRRRTQPATRSRIQISNLPTAASRFITIPGDRRSNPGRRGRAVIIPSSTRNRNAHEANELDDDEYDEMILDDDDDITDGEDIENSEDDGDDEDNGDDGDDDSDGDEYNDDDDDDDDGDDVDDEEDENDFITDGESLTEEDSDVGSSLRDISNVSYDFSTTSESSIVSISDSSFETDDPLQFMASTSLSESQRRQNAQELQQYVGEYEPVDVDYNVPSVKELNESLIKSAEHGDCPICYDDTPVDPVGCIYCRNFVGCRQCIQRWVQTGKERRSEDNSANCSNHYACPFCRQEWGDIPEVESIFVLEFQ